MISNNQRVRYACYTTNLCMSIVGNLSPILFLTFHSLYGISYSLLGLLILGQCILSVIQNRKDRPSQLAGFWLGFSLLVLVVLGWGTQENGLILYALYFGWAVWVLLFRLLQKLDDRIPHLTAIAGILILGALAIWNLPAMGKLVSFALTYYPI